MKESRFLYDTITIYKQKDTAFAINQLLKCYNIPLAEQSHFMKKWEKNKGIHNCGFKDESAIKILSNLHIRLGNAFLINKNNGGNKLADCLSTADGIRLFIKNLCGVSTYNINITIECSNAQHLLLAKEICKTIKENFENFFLPYFLLIIPSEISDSNDLAILKNNSMIKAVATVFPEKNAFLKHDFSSNRSEIYILNFFPESIADNALVNKFKDFHHNQFLLKLDPWSDSEKNREKLKALSYDAWEYHNFNFWGHNLFRIYSLARYINLPNIRMENNLCAFTRAAIDNDLRVYPSFDHLEMNLEGVEITPEAFRLSSGDHFFWPGDITKEWLNNREQCKTSCHLFRLCCACLKEKRCGSYRSVFEGLFARYINEYIAH